MSFIKRFKRYLYFYVFNYIYIYIQPNTVCIIINLILYIKFYLFIFYLLNVLIFKKCQLWGKNYFNVGEIPEIYILTIIHVFMYFSAQVIVYNNIIYCMLHIP